MYAPPGSRIDSACPTLGKSSYLKTLTGGTSRLSPGHEWRNAALMTSISKRNTLSDEELGGGTPHVSCDGVVISSGIGIQNDDSVASAQIPLPNSGISRPVEPAGGEWRDLLSSSHSSANCPKLVHFSDSGNAENCTLFLYSNCDVWKVCVVAGKFHGFEALNSFATKMVEFCTKLFHMLR
ncbi:hypothetical protein OIU79_002607 [Salix purpurea]|uniref:Uncharacterized protein n=1 Tax=Salix purpurea TaxID=77065 RepID=A0A9Q0ZED1_SALPP|nr:hypothetical protein OIU79_002607 [Salix purpurea]